MSISLSYPQKTELLKFIYEKEVVNEQEIKEKLVEIMGGEKEAAAEAYEKYKINWYAQEGNVVRWRNFLEEIISDSDNRALSIEHLEQKIFSELYKVRFKTWITQKFVRYLLDKIPAKPKPPRLISDFNDPETVGSSVSDLPMAPALHQQFFDQSMALMEEWREIIKKSEWQIEELRQENQQLQLKLKDGEQKIKEAENIMQKENAYLKQISDLEKEKENTKKDVLTKLIQNVEDTCKGFFTEAKYETGNLTAYGATVLNLLLDILREEGLQLYLPVLDGKELKPGCKVACTPEVRDKTRPEQGTTWNDIGDGPVELAKPGVKLGDRVVYQPVVRPVKEV